MMDKYVLLEGPTRKFILTPQITQKEKPPQSLLANMVSGPLVQMLARNRSVSESILLRQ